MEPRRPPDPVLYERAKARRHDPTPAEVVLWERLRNRRLGGFKFRREQPLASYIADFFCAEVRVAIELDGDSHVGKEDRDARRQRYIEGQDITVLRFWNCEVYDDLDLVLEVVWAALHRSRGETPPPG